MLEVEPLLLEAALPLLPTAPAVVSYKLRERSGLSRLGRGFLWPRIGRAPPSVLELLQLLEYKDSPGVALDKIQSCFSHNGTDSLVSLPKASAASTADLLAMPKRDGFMEATRAAGRPCSVVWSKSGYVHCRLCPWS